MTQSDVSEYYGHLNYDRSDLLPLYPFGVDFELSEIPVDCERTKIGWAFGASRQWRGPEGLHIREYQGRYFGHYDRVDPRKKLIGHWILDAPFELAVGSTGVIGMFASLTTNAPAAVTWITATLVASIATSTVARRIFS